MSYSAFARYYDCLTKNVNYKERATYFCTLMEQLKHNPGLTLDLACGTGSFTLELAEKGIDVYGVDGSMEMLSVAQQKAAAQGKSVLFLCQQMQNLDLYGTVDTVVCTLDSLNHLSTEAEVQKTFEKVSLFLDPENGLFLFDVNTPYKHRAVLGNNAFVYDTDNVYCVWQNHFEEQGCRVGIDLDFFEREGAFYHRSSEHFYERAYSLEQLSGMLQKAGFSVLKVLADLSFDAPGEKTERIVIAAGK